MISTMYTSFFQLKQAPFSIAPDPHSLYLSQRHREALAHLVYGARSDGGVVLLTGEVGAGKTTICRCFLEQIPAHCNVAYIFNPKLNAIELLQVICEEFHLLPHDEDELGTSSAKRYIDILNRFLLEAHAQGRHSMLIIDEAQNLSVEVLEELRLLTNLETRERKLLQIVLIGQPELRDMLARPELKQLAQRVIARYHLEPLSAVETEAYIRHRLAAAGMPDQPVFTPRLMKRIHRLTQGVPRRINLLCDRALLGAYVCGTRAVDRKILDGAEAELSGTPRGRSRGGPLRRIMARISANTPISAAATVASAAAFTAAVFVFALQALPDLPYFGAHPTTAAAAPEATITPPAKAAIASATNVPAQSVEVAADKNVLRIDSEHEAVRQLAALWDMELDASPPCATAEKRGLRCYEGRAGFAELRRLDRPAVMRLRDANEHPYYVLLTGLADADVTLRAGNITRQIPAVVVAQRFRGEFITLWRSPPGMFDIVRTGRTGAAVDWIAQQLSTLHSTTHPPAGTPFTATMRQQLIDFQRAEGLVADGTAGPVTFMRLNRAAGVQEPRLEQSTQRDSAKARAPKPTEATLASAGGY